MKLADSLLICESVLLENEKSESKNSSKIKIKQLLEIESNNNISVNNQLPVITEEVLVICGLLLFLEGIDGFFFFKGYLTPWCPPSGARVSRRLARTWKKTGKHSERWNSSPIVFSISSQRELLPGSHLAPRKAFDTRIHQG